MKRATVAVFEMGLSSHLACLRPMVTMLVAAGLDVHVFTDRRLEDEVRGMGAWFVDLDPGRSAGLVEESDFFGSEFVAFVGEHGDEVVAAAAAIRPALVIADTFALIGSVVARTLDVPYVNVCAGHNIDPAGHRERLSSRPALTVSPRLQAQIDVVRDHFGVADASQFSWFTSVSSVLNVYCEPPQYLPEETRKLLEPLVFLGSLPSLEELSTWPVRAPARGPGGERRVYVSLGTNVWRPANRPVTLRALGAIAEALGDRPDLQATISLAGAFVDEDEIAPLRSPNVTVEPRVDQLATLAEADLFITQNGLNSTHEAVFYGVPMISYPFFFDQPSQARTCERFGFAIPLAEAPRAPFEPDDVHRALDRYEATRDEMLAALGPAREWELEVIAGRPQVVERIVELL